MHWQFFVVSPYITVSTTLHVLMVTGVMLLMTTEVYNNTVDEMNTKYELSGFHINRISLYQVPRKKIRAERMLHSIM